MRFGYTSLELTADARLDREVTFGGTTFRLDAQVASLLDLEYGGLGFAWQLLATGDGRVRLGPLIEARGLRGEAAIRSRLLDLIPLRAAEEFEVAFTSAGFVLDVEPTRRLHLHAQWKTTVETDDGDLTDLEAGLRYFPVDALAVTAGYRRLEIDFQDGDESFDLELDGPYLGALLRF